MDGPGWIRLPYAEADSPKRPAHLPRCNSLYSTRVLPSCPTTLAPVKPAQPPAGSYTAQPMLGSSAYFYAGTGSSAVSLPAGSSSHVPAGSSTVSLPAGMPAGSGHYVTAGSSAVTLPAGAGYHTIPAPPMSGYATPSRVSYVATPQRMIVSQAPPRMVIRPASAIGPAALPTKPAAPEVAAAPATPAPEPTSPEAPTRTALTEEEEKRALSAIKQLFDGRHPNGRICFCPPADMEEFYLELEREKYLWQRDPKRHVKLKGPKSVVAPHLRADSDTRLYAGEKLKNLVDEFDTKQKIAGKIRQEWEVEQRALERAELAAAAEKERVEQEAKRSA